MQRSFFFLSIFICFTSLTNAQQWLLTGNAGTNPAIHFVGTTDNVPLKFRVNNIQSGYISQSDLAVFFGQQSGNSNTGTYNTGIGYSAMRNTTTGNLNTSVGAQSMTSNTTGVGNSAFGFNALLNSVSGRNNTAIGMQTLSSNSSGSNNTAVGFIALQGNITGYSNTAVGSHALVSSIHRHNQVAIGDSALFNNGWYSPVSSVDGSFNTAVGSKSMYSNTTGYLNTAIGYRSLHSITTGNYNTAIGYNAYPINGAVSNYTGIGYNVGNSASVSNSVEIGNSSVTWIGGQVGWSTYSDKRIKENIQEDVKGLEFILKLKPVTYNLNIRKQHAMVNNGKTLEKENDWPEKFKIESKRITGFIAQDVEEAAKQSKYDFDGVTKPESQDGLYSLRYSEFVVPLVKAIQEQQQMIEKLEKRIKELEKKTVNCAHVNL